MVTLGERVTDGLDRLPTPTLEPHGEHLLHVAFFGDQSTGQSTVLRIFRQDGDFESRPSESFVTNVSLEGAPFRVRLTDLSGQAVFARRVWSPRVSHDGHDRDVQGTLGDSIKNTADALVACFSVDRRESLEALENQFIPEVVAQRKRGKAQAPIILLGLQTDLRATSADPVTTAEGVEMSEKLGCAGYLEATAMEPNTASDAVYKVLLTAREFLYRKLQAKRKRLARRVEADQTMQELHVLTPTLGDLRIPPREVPEFSFPVGVIPPMQTLVEDTHPLQQGQIQAGLGCLGVTPSLRHAYLRCELPGLMLTSGDLLRNYRNLQEVDVSDNRLRTLDFLDGLPFLIRLNASRNLLTTINTFCAPRQLETADFSYNLLGDLGNWQVHRHLKKLSVKGNFLEQIGTGLQLCEYLTVLDVSCNNIQELHGLDGLRLVELYASANSLTSLDGIAALDALQVLALADNQLSDLSDLRSERHPVLMRLDVRHNLLAHHARIQALEGFAYLKDLYLSPNPLDQVPEYRAQMLYRLGTLRWLDDAPALAEEKVKAAVIYGLEVQEKEQIFKAVLPRETFQDRRHVTEEDILAKEKEVYGQVGGFLDDLGDTTEVYA
jgi:GTPase SAR1 family protein